MMFLVDTNVFLEILLGRDRKGDCKKFLDRNSGSIGISDFSFHSLGVILFRYGKEDIFVKFIDDVMPNVVLLSLPVEAFGQVVSIRKDHGMDFDDAYQYATAKYFDLEVVTMDKDFRKAGDPRIRFL